MPRSRSIRGRRNATSASAVNLQSSLRGTFKAAGSKEPAAESFKKSERKSNSIRPNRGEALAVVRLLQ